MTMFVETLVGVAAVFLATPVLMAIWTRAYAVAFFVAVFWFVWLAIVLGAITQ